MSWAAAFWILLALSFVSFSFLGWIILRCGQVITAQDQALRDADDEIALLRKLAKPADLREIERLEKETRP